MNDTKQLISVLRQNFVRHQWRFLFWFIFCCCWLISSISIWNYPIGHSLLPIFFPLLLVLKPQNVLQRISLLSSTFIWFLIYFLFLFRFLVVFCCWMKITHRKCSIFLLRLFVLLNFNFIPNVVLKCRSKFIWKSSDRCDFQTPFGNVCVSVHSNRHSSVFQQSIVHNLNCLWFDLMDFYFFHLSFKLFQWQSYCG